MKQRDDDGTHVKKSAWTADPRFRTFVRLFDEARFFEAHEVLEELWLATAGEERPLIQGLIQIAVALEHRRRGNEAGARKVLRSAVKRLAPFGERGAGLPIGDLRRRVESYLERPAGESEPPAFCTEREG